MKVFRMGKEFRHQKVEHCPQLLHIVLKWSSCQEKSGASVDGSTLLVNLRLGVFQFVRFINNQVLPFSFQDEAETIIQCLESRNANIECAGPELILNYLLSEIHRGL